MRYMTAKEIRETWLRFFENKGHKIEPSASLIPVNDNTLLWINAGVAPLKKYFDGREAPPNKRLTNAQKCIRTNDIENVGKTARHHTFFEMLGNFSIGDYFKNEAIEFAYELLFSEKYFGFPIDKIYITYYPCDLETKEKWLSLGINESHILPKEDNFWEIGEGPCGPDTEIHFDRGEEYDKRGVELVRDDIENERYIELWNIVFSQFNAKPGLSRDKYPELPNKNIDTGAGLERFACILQGTKTNFETDLFYPIIEELSVITSMPYDGQMAFKVIADHIKTLVFSISDGAVLSNEGRGYVLRRLLRRAVKYGYNLGLNQPFLYKLVDSVILMMEDFYPNLVDSREICEELIKKEEIKFFQTIEAGQRHILEEISKGIKQIDGKTAFKLYDTYGFPIELTIEYAEEAKIEVDLEGFKAELEAQKERSRSARTNTNSMASQDEKFINFKDASKFIGYNTLELKTRIIKIFEEGVVLKETPFYATSGGQMADRGTINGIEVLDVIKLPNGQHLHVVDFRFKEEDEVLAIVNKDIRNDIMRNHSATHLLQKALKETLGNHVNQQGSFVSNRLLRFDFNNYNPLTDLEILKIEALVNEKIHQNNMVKVATMPIEQAKELGAMALFSEKYGDEVRVVMMGDSIELCGGTHVENTKDIISFCITSVESIGSGIYRVEAITGKNLDKRIMEFLPQQLSEVESIFYKSNPLNIRVVSPTLIGSYQDILDIRNYIELLKKANKDNEKYLGTKKANDALSNIDEYIPSTVQKRMLIETNDLEIPVLKQLVDAIYDKIKAEVLFVVNREQEKATFVCKSNQNNALDLIKLAAAVSNGSGGGRPNLAQGGTKDLASIDLVIRTIKEQL